MATVLGALDAYERGAAGDGLRVDMNRGRYLDRSRGGNWWAYHFAPLRIGRQDGPDVSINNHAPLAYAAAVYDRRHAHALLARYVTLCDEVRETIEQFRARHFVGRPVVGLHFRGTDKPGELLNVVTYEQAIDRARLELDQLGPEAVIFVASDEQDFMLQCVQTFSPRCVWADADRSSRGGTPLHYAPRDPFRHGREALIDCLLLAESNVLVRTSSNLGAFAGFFSSPDTRVIKLNRSHFESE